MRLVKPYGRTIVENEDGQSRRDILRRPEFTRQERIPDFVREDDHVVIAQWISVIDKIATKPSGKQGATDEQRRLREKLGAAAWAEMVTRAILPGSETKKALKARWDAKIHPYGDRPCKPGARSGKGKSVPSPSPKGRWFDRFTDGAETVDQVDAAAVAARIYEHLYEAEYRLSPEAGQKRRGLIEARGESIARNTLDRATPGIGEAFDDEHWAAYAAAGNVAVVIREAAVDRQKGKDQARTRRVTADIAGKALHAHYAKLFGRADGTVPGVRELGQDNQPLFTIHQAVKDTYQRLLKRHKKTRKGEQGETSGIIATLPKDMNALRRLVEHKKSNRDLAALVRLGKIIHYEARGTNQDSPINPIQNWPDADRIQRSEWWSSAGQARIKRNEALVRTWRHMLALAQRTLTDWADPHNQCEQDVLGQRQIDKATQADFRRGCQDQDDRKIKVLFGDRAERFMSGDSRTATLKTALKGVQGLRNAGFHFKGVDGFVKALDGIPASDCDQVNDAVEQLWRTDQEQRPARLWATLQGAAADRYLAETTLKPLLAALVAPENEKARLPLPRFKRMLERAHNAWPRGLELPDPPNSETLAASEPLRCRYITLHELYSRPFRAWLEGRNQKTLNRWINKAMGRATKAAQDINAGQNQQARAQIAARAEKVGKLGADDTIHDFFARLSGETATEMRVQRGYESDAEKAQKQAAYLDDLKRDVVALAFVDFLKDRRFWCLTRLNENKSARKTPVVLPPPAPCVAQPFDWQPRLYFLLHLVPVNEVSTLLHQLRKWQALVGKAGKQAGRRKQGDRAAPVEATDKVEALIAVLSLYLDMHDAKYDGGAVLRETEGFRVLFASEQGFDRVFPARPGANGVDEARIPRRGLREVLRFGHLDPLMPLFEQHKITDETVKTFLDLESEGEDGKDKIAVCQQSRKELHQKWVKQKKKIRGQDLKDYVTALQAVTKHRHAAAQTLLTDHVRLHRLMMAVLGRLVDYAGLWERDLYFATLGAMHRAGSSPAQAFTEKGLEKLQSGQIVAALRKASESRLQETLKPHFGEVWQDRNEETVIRNNFAHFNMLQGGASVPNLTACVNDARRLMAYDRKLKNAVSKSIKELLLREGFSLAWTMDNSHKLDDAYVGPNFATHLTGTKLSLNVKKAGKGNDKKISICEPLHSQMLVSMLAQLFGGKVKAGHRGIEALDLDRVGWPEPECLANEGGNHHRKKRHNQGPKPRNRPKNTGPKPQ